MESNALKYELITNITFLRSYLYNEVYKNKIDDILLDVWILSGDLCNEFERLINEPNLEKSIDKLASHGLHNLIGTIAFFNKLLMKPFEAVIIEQGNLLDIYRFARDIKCADIKILEDAICNSDRYDKALYAYLFAYLEGADVLRLGQIVIDSNDIELNYLFAKNIKGADIEAHEKVLLNAKNRISMDADQYCYLFAKNVDGAKVEEHEKVISDNHGKYENGYYKCLFSRDVLGKNSDNRLRG